MNLKINSRHVEVTPAMRSHLEAGLAKIRKHFDHVIDASAFLIVDKAKEKDLRQSAEITIHLKGRTCSLKHTTPTFTMRWMRW